ncbi:unnamed protein product, partial [Ixodes persulcatus]
MSVPTRRFLSFDTGLAPPGLEIPQAVSWQYPALFGRHARWKASEDRGSGPWPSLLEPGSGRVLHLDVELLQGGLQGGLVPREVGRHRIVEQQQLLVHHLHLQQRAPFKGRHLVLLEELHLDGDVRLELLVLVLVQGEVALGLVHLGRNGVALGALGQLLQVRPVRVILQPVLPGALIEPDGEQGVVDGLVAQGGQGGDKEVERTEQGLPVAAQGALGLRVVAELFLQRRAPVGQLLEGLRQQALRLHHLHGMRGERSGEPEHVQVLGLGVPQQLDLGLQLSVHRPCSTDLPQLLRQHLSGALVGRHAPLPEVVYLRLARLDHTGVAPVLHRARARQRHARRPTWRLGGPGRGSPEGGGGRRPGSSGGPLRMGHGAPRVDRVPALVEGRHLVQGLAKVFLKLSVGPAAAVARGRRGHH